jgi:hypothetical protein
MDEDEHNTGEAVFGLHGSAYEGPGCPIADYDHGSWSIGGTA